MTNGEKLRLGEILIEAGVLTEVQLKSALAIQKQRQLRLGTILLQERFVTEKQLVQALSRRLSIPWVSLWHIDIEESLLQLVPANVAEEFFLIPIYVRSDGDDQKALYVAMNDPTDESALRFVAASSGMPVKPMIAGPSDIAAAIRAYYYDDDDDSSEAPGPVAPVAHPAAGKPKPPAGLKVSQPPPPPTEKPKAPMSEDKQRALREVEKHMFGVGSDKAKKGISLTLLDGTQINFGGNAAKKSSGDADVQLLIEGLRARASGAVEPGSLPSDHWEDYLAAVLEILLRKHLISPAELISELARKKS
jgi:hypothetical protein